MTYYLFQTKHEQFLWEVEEGSERPHSEAMPISKESYERLQKENDPEILFNTKSKKYR